MRILLTAFEPYDVWEKNSSWEGLVAYLTRRGGNPSIVTRRYPVDLVKLRSRLESDLSQGIDAVLHLGQAPRISEVHLEAIALNVVGFGPTRDGEYEALAEEGPLAYRTRYPIGKWGDELRAEGIPARVSYHAGTYLCNAAMYLSHHWFARRQETPWVGFVHLPLLPEQDSADHRAVHMSTSVTSRAIELLIDRILKLPIENQVQLA